MSRTYTTRRMVDEQLEAIEATLPSGPLSPMLAMATLDVKTLCMLVRAVADLADEVRKVVPRD